MRGVVIAAALVVLGACSGGGDSRPIDAGVWDAPPDGQVIEEIGSVWRKEIWAGHLMELSLAALAGDRILMGEYEEGLVLLDLDGNQLAQWPWPAIDGGSMRQHVSIAHGEVISVFVDGFPPKLLWVADDQLSAPVEVPVDSITLISDGNFLRILGAVAEGFGLYSFDGATLSGPVF